MPSTSIGTPSGTSAVPSSSNSSKILRVSFPSFSLLDTALTPPEISEPKPAPVTVPNVVSIAVRLASKSTSPKSSICSVAFCSMTCLNTLSAAP